MPRKGSGRRQALLEDKDVQRWYNNLARGSRATADNYLRMLGLFLEANRLTPKGIVKLRPKRRDDLLSDYIDAKATEKGGGSGVAVVKKAVVSWLDWNGLSLTRRIKVPNANRRPRLREAHIPSQEELRRVLNVSAARARTAVALMAFAGQREEVMGTYLGDDGLTLGNLPEAKLEDGTLVFEKIPTRIDIPERLSKTGTAFFSFMGPEGCEYLASSVRQRSEAGEAIGPDSPLITPRNAEKAFIRTSNIGDLIRKPMRSAGLKEPPYIWRSYFSSRAMLAESTGLTKDFKEFMMGHKGGIAEVYSLHKRLPPDTVEAMRRGYEAALEYLETTPRGPREDPTLKMVAVLLQAAGYTNEEVARMDLASKTEEELISILRKGADRDGGNGGAKTGAWVGQRIIPLDRLDAALADGWAFRASLPDGRAVVEAGKARVAPLAD